MRSQAASESEQIVYSISSGMVSSAEMMGAVAH